MVATGSRAVLAANIIQRTASVRADKYLGRHLGRRNTSDFSHEPHQTQLLFGSVEFGHD